MFLSEIHDIFCHICENSGFITPRLSVGIQAIMFKVLGKFLIDKIQAILDMEAYYNFMANIFINKLLVPRGEQAGLILDEDFGSHKDHRVVEVALCKRIFWDRLRQIRLPGGLG